MGVVSKPIGVDINKVRQVFGSKDAEIFDRARNTPNFRHYSGQEPAGDYEKALKDIIFNYRKPAERKESSSLFGLIKSKEDSGLKMRPALYGYALISLCEALGTDLAEEGDIYYMGHEFEMTNDYLVSKGVKVTMKRFETSANLFDIPHNNDWPIINAFTKEEVVYLYNEISKIPLAASEAEDEEDLEYDAELLRHFKSKLKLCVDQHYDWVSIAH